MALCHRSLPVYGVQFHPESVGTGHGKRILANFLSPLVGLRQLSGVTHCIRVRLARPLGT